MCLRTLEKAINQTDDVYSQIFTECCKKHYFLLQDRSSEPIRVAWVAADTQYLTSVSVLLVAWEPW